MRIFPRLQRHIDAALANPSPAPGTTEPEEDFASEAKAPTTTPTGGKK